MKFYTSATNSRGKEVRAGAHKGQTVHTRGWTQGVKVISSIDGDDEVFDVYVTGGSNNPAAKKKIGFLRDGVWHGAGE